MNTVLQIVLFICFYPILPIMYFTFQNEAKPKKNIILGVTLPYHARQDAAISVLCRKFKRQLDRYALILAVLPLPVFFIKYISVIITYYLIWMTLVIAFPFLSFVICHRRIKLLKKERGWDSPAAGNTLVDIKVAAASKQRYRIRWFLPPVVISLIPVVHTIAVYGETEEFWWRLMGYAVFTLLIAAFYIFYRMLHRQKADTVEEDTALNMALTQVRRHNWSKCFIGMAWLTGIYNLFFWMFIDSGTALLISTAVYTVALLYTAMQAEFTARRVQQKLTKESGQSLYAEEDNYWIMGMLYYNPNDRHLFINNRIGIGMTMNLAKRSAKIVYILAFLCVFAMPCLGIWIMKEEFTPPGLTLNETRLMAIHTSTVYTIELEEVVSVQLLDTLPSASRIVGSGFPTLLKGKFRVAGIGTGKLCLNPRTAPFLVIITGQDIYILGSDNSGETLAVYEALSE